MRSFTASPATADCDGAGGIATGIGTSAFAWTTLAAVADGWRRGCPTGDGTTVRVVGTVAWAATTATGPGAIGAGWITGAGAGADRTSCAGTTARLVGPWSFTRKVRVTTSSSAVGRPVIWLSQAFQACLSAMR